MTTTDPQTADGEPTGTVAQPAQLAARGVIQGEARDDGYRPICDALWTWASLLGFPSVEAYRLITSGARRLDSAHLQIERVRAGIESAPPIGSIAHRERMHEVIGDAELAMIALDKAIDIMLSLGGRYKVPGSVPAIITAKRALIASMRDHYSHIDERALGKVLERPDPKAEEPWDFVALVDQREFTDGHETLGIDDEVTELCIAARGYFISGWTHVVAQARQK